MSNKRRQKKSTKRMKNHIRRRSITYAHPSPSFIYLPSLASLLDRNGFDEDRYIEEFKYKKQYVEEESNDKSKSYPIYILFIFICSSSDLVFDSSSYTKTERIIEDLPLPPPPPLLPTSSSITLQEPLPLPPPPPPLPQSMAGFQSNPYPNHVLSFLFSSSVAFPHLFHLYFSPSFSL